MTIPLPARGSHSWFTWAQSITAWINTGGTGSGGGGGTVETMPAGATITVQKNTDGSWPARPTARADVFVQWKGPDPGPAIVSAGTGGMRSGIDWRLVQ